MKIAFVGQPEYFSMHYPDNIPDIEIEIYNINPFIEGDWTRLIGKEADIWYLFRGDKCPTHIFNKLVGKKILISSEPINRLVFNSLLHTKDTNRRTNDLFRGIKEKKPDLIFHYDKISIPYLAHSFKDLVFSHIVFPINTNLIKPLDIEKKWALGFFGRSTNWREFYMGILKRDYKFLHIVHGAEKEFFNEMMNKCKIVLNLHHENIVQTEPRVYQVMATNSLLMSELITDTGIIDGVHYVKINENNYQEKIDYYLENWEEAEKIIKNANSYIKEHLDANNKWRMLSFLLK